MSDRIQKVNVMDRKWDNLIVLDSCRYDFFEKISSDYLNGTLKKIYSCGSHTIEWLRNTFKKYYGDVIYISSNPFVNSAGISKRVGLWKFKPKEHFSKIVDVWNWGWNKKLRIIHPKKVNEAAHKIAREHPNKRLIIHYMQPHPPYIGLSVERKQEANETFLDEMKGFVRWSILEKLGMSGYKTAKKLVGIPDFPQGRIAKKIGIEGLIQVYERNLRFVLKYVTELIGDLRGKTYLTSDHGELLGERGMYCHFPNLNVPELLEVPWLEVEK